MRTTFNAAYGLIIVDARVAGPIGSAMVRLALDTGATRTLLPSSFLVGLGYDPSASPERARVTTGSGIETAPRVIIQRISAPGIHRTSLSALVMNLPHTTSVNGVLGLDFFRGSELTIDFRRGTIRLRQ